MRDMLSNITLAALKYFYINHGDQRFFQIEIIIYVLVSSIDAFHLNTFVMDLRPL